jgi:prephenate dehydratase
MAGSATRWICSSVCRTCKSMVRCRVHIHHNLVANCEPQEIRRIYSKAQALSQCRNWLAKNMPSADQGCEQYLDRC